MQKENCSYIKENYISSSNNELDGDWAFYKGEFNYKKSKIYSKELKIQEEVFAIGNAWGVQSWVSRGNVSWIDKEKLVHIQGFCAPGCSGGGVFKGNKVAGIIVAIHFNDFGPETTQLIAIPVSKMSIF